MAKHMTGASARYPGSGALIKGAGTKLASNTKTPSPGKKIGAKQAG